LTFDFGQLIPSLCMEMVPGDSFEMSNDIIVRFQAMLSPPLHQVDLSVHYFFVPNRLLWPKEDTSGADWESFITGGQDGLNSAVLPRWNVSSGKHSVGSLWDYFGLPTWDTANDFATAYTDAVKPLSFPLLAYNLIWNEYYRDETLQNVIEPLSSNEDILVRNWSKDFFTSALPWQQRGTAPALPVSGYSAALWPDTSFVNSVGSAAVGVAAASADPRFQSSGAFSNANLKGALQSNVVDLSSATTFDIADFRLAAVIQRWLERNATGGIRYTEFLQGVFGVYPRDERIALHIRRGDYQKTNFYVDLTTNGYYDRALAMFPNQKFLLFCADRQPISNDISDKKWCNDWLMSKSVNFEVWDGKDEIDDFNAMAACKGMIIANSSFSTWAAFVNPNPDKKIVAPKEYYSDGVERTVLPKNEGWIYV